MKALVNEKGMFSFYEDGHKECCGVRKVKPLRAKLGDAHGVGDGATEGSKPRDAKRGAGVPESIPVFEGAAGRRGKPGEV